MTVSAAAANFLEMPGTLTPFTITLASLAATPAGRQSTLITGFQYPWAKVTCKFTCNGTPTANTGVEVYRIYSDGTLITDNLGASDAAGTPIGAKLLSIALVGGSPSSNQVLTTDFWILHPGPTWGILVWNACGVALDATAGHHVCNYQGFNYRG